MKVFYLMKKDLSFCENWAIISIIFTVLMPIYFVRCSGFSEVLLAPTLLFTGLLGANLLISRVCYIEDNYETKKFIEALPVKKQVMIFSRYIENFAINVLLLVVVFSISNILNVGISFSLICFFLGISFIYSGLYLIFFYKWGSNVAQYAFLGFAAFVATIYFAMEHLSLFNISIVEINCLEELFLIAGFVFYILSAYVSCVIVEK